MGTVVDFPNRDTLATARLIVSAPTEHEWHVFSAACQVLMEHGSAEDRVEVYGALSEWERAKEQPIPRQPVSAGAIIILFLAAVGAVAIVAWLLDLAMAVLT